MNIDRKKINFLIKEAVTKEMTRKIEELWWTGNTPEDSFVPYYDFRPQALQLMSALGIDPETLRIWEVSMPATGEFVDEFPLTVEEISSVLELHNADPRTKLEMVILKKPIDKEDGAIFAYVDIGINSDDDRAIDFGWPYEEDALHNRLASFYESKTGRKSRYENY